MTAGRATRQMSPPPDREGEGAEDGRRYTGRRRARVAGALLLVTLAAGAWACSAGRAFQHGNNAAMQLDWDLAVHVLRGGRQGGSRAGRLQDGPRTRAARGGPGPLREGPRLREARPARPGAHGVPPRGRVPPVQPGSARGHPAPRADDSRPHRGGEAGAPRGSDAPAGAQADGGARAQPGVARAGRAQVPEPPAEGDPGFPRQLDRHQRRLRQGLPADRRRSTWTSTA